MNSADLQRAFRSLMESPLRGACLAKPLQERSEKQLNDLFDSVAEDDLMELGRLVSAWLKPVAEQYVQQGLQQKVVLSRVDDEL
jgi:hypothetical protein